MHMTHDRTIHEYLDGALTSEEEARLFHELANREDLRNELSAQIQLHTAVRKDYGAVVVPQDSTQAIFNELGLSLPTPVATPLVRGSSFVLDHLGGILLIALPMLFLASITLHRNSEIPLSLRGVAWQNNPSDSLLNRASGEGIAANNEVPKRTVTTTELPETQQPEDVYVSKASLIDVENSDVGAHQAVNEELPRSIMDVPRFSVDEPHKAQIDVTLRSMALTTSVPDPELTVPNTMMPFAVGAHYRLNEEHAIGLDAGYEAFPQEYSRTINGQTDVYRQAPSLGWIGATYRYTAVGLSIANVVIPYASGTIAYTAVGPLIRSTVGVNIRPEHRLSLLVGLEGTALFYPIQSQFFSTRTLQVTYGISYRF